MRFDNRSDPSGITRKKIMPNANRAPAREAMQKRTRVSFGEAYTRDVIAGTQRDVAKQISHAVAIGAVSEKNALRMKFDTVHEKLVDALKATPAEEQPKNAPFINAALH